MIRDKDILTPYISECIACRKMYRIPAQMLADAVEWEQGIEGADAREFMVAKFLEAQCPVCSEGRYITGLYPNLPEPERTTAGRAWANFDDAWEMIMALYTAWDEGRVDTSRITELHADDTHELANIAGRLYQALMPEPEEEEE